MWLIFFIIAIVINGILNILTDKFLLSNNLKIYSSLNLLIWSIVLGLLPVVFSVSNISQVENKQSLSSYQKIIRINESMYILDNKYNKINITDDVKIVNHSDTNIIKIQFDQDNWFVDGLTPDGITYDGVVNIKDIEEVR